MDWRKRQNEGGKKERREARQMGWRKRQNELRKKGRTEHVVLWVRKKLRFCVQQEFSQ